MEPRFIASAWIAQGIKEAAEVAYVLGGTSKPIEEVAERLDLAIQRLEQAREQLGCSEDGSPLEDDESARREIKALEQQLHRCVEFHKRDQADLRTHLTSAHEKIRKLEAARFELRKDFDKEMKLFVEQLLVEIERINSLISDSRKMHDSLANLWFAYKSDAIGRKKIPKAARRKKTPKKEKPRTTKKART
jgi:hypothetical protein